MELPPFAIRFLPESGGEAVALDAFAGTLEEIVQGLESLRHTLAPILAQRVGWPTADVRDYLRLAVLPVRRGSAVVPVVMGAHFPDATGGGGALLDARNLARTFWRYGSAALNGAARQRVGVADIPAVCAEQFAKASKIAREKGHAGLELVERKRPRKAVRRARDPWRPTVHLTRIEGGLIRYAERRSARRSVETVLIGVLRGLVWNPPQAILELPDGQTRTLALTAAQRQEARTHWGFEVAAYVDANITLEGEIRDTPKVRSIRRTIQIENLAQDLKDTFGVGRDVWGTKEAEEYLKGLRGDS